MEGRLEIFLHGSWGTVCEDNFDPDDSGIVCDQLGFPGGTYYILQNCIIHN